ncbi:MAG TPA: hypothetical protein VLD36_13025 [Burkholderiales bacterium]|nr:hypothetical protein [Burkholderiales bacterium]
MSRSAPIFAPPPPRAKIDFGPPMMPLHSARFSPALVMRTIAMSLRSVQWKSRSIAGTRSMLFIPTYGAAAANFTSPCEIVTSDHSGARR